MKWFGWKAAQPLARPALVRSGIGVPLGEWPRSYEAQVRDAYVANPVAQRAVRLVAEGVAGVPVYAAPGQAPAAALVPPVIEAIAAQMLLHGNAYVQVIADAGDMPVELLPLRPERVTVEQDARGWPAGYLYRAGEAVTRYPAADALGRATIVHLKALHPLDDHYGLGCLGAAAGAVAIHNAATRWNKALLDNAARPSGALVYDAGEGAVLSPDQYERLKAEMEAGFAGAANAGRPMLLEGGLKWQAMSLTPADMDFVALKAAAAREIALAFGVPPMLLGLPGDVSYANYSEANRALWRLAIVPLAGKIVAGLGAALAAWWPGLALQLDLDAIPALSADRERLWGQVAAADFLSVDEKREMLGFGPAGGIA
ncbi:phage portal protein [Sphingomonas profundi]|uniref:phage portal protein n=1 Tax=Alterirhizorhabdus profundi TaxID=2681549 RepID=UPI0012E7D556|nr:phage portal protein [Sphingomonas profundi]